MIEKHLFKGWNIEKIWKNEAIDQQPAETQHGGPQKLQARLLWSWSKSKLRNMSSATHRSGICCMHLLQLHSQPYCPGANRPAIQAVFGGSLFFSSVYSTSRSSRAGSLASAAPWWHRLEKAESHHSLLTAQLRPGHEGYRDIQKNMSDVVPENGDRPAKSSNLQGNMPSGWDGLAYGEMKPYWSIGVVTAL